jgi:dihydromethanopterin reductase (acceptor)
MTLQIAWGITGAGCWLFESFEIIGQLLANPSIKIDLFFSKAGREVAQCYGVFKSPVPINQPFIDKVREIPHFNQYIFKPGFVESYQWLGLNDSKEINEYFNLIEEKKQANHSEEDIEEAFNDVIFEIDEGASYPASASASNCKYNFIIISPATGNTVNKLSNGIADNLVSNLAIMGNKCKDTEILILPTDYEKGDVKSYLPIMLHQETCKKCSECSALWACKPGAIRRKRGKVRINRLKCIGCLDCVKFCRYGVITFCEEITVTVREQEALAAAKIAKQKGFKVFKNPSDLRKYLLSKIK